MIEVSICNRSENPWISLLLNLSWLVGVDCYINAANDNKYIFVTDNPEIAQLVYSYFLFLQRWSGGVAHISNFERRTYQC
jgi:hypothetical protein